MGTTMFSNIPPITKALLIANGVVFLLQQLAGDPAFAERLPLEVRPQLKDIARERLDRCHMVEVWQGPACVLRLRRDGAVHA